MDAAESLVAALTDACGRYEADSEFASAAAARAEEREQTVRAQRKGVRHRRVLGFLKFPDLVSLQGLHGVRRDVYFLDLRQPRRTPARRRPGASAAPTAAP